MSTKRMPNSVAIIGGGAAGMFAACVASELGADVTLYEKTDRLGKKLGITGKGRCNLTNLCDVNEFLVNVPRGGKFMYSALYGFTPQDTMNYFEGLGVPLKVERGNRVFPVSDRAGDIVFALKNKLSELSVKVIHKKVSGISVNDGKVDAVICDKKKYFYNSIILATGGLSYPATGSTGDGYKIAESLGHTVVSPTPSLVPLETEGRTAQSMQGLSLKNVSLKVIDNDKKKIVYDDFGEMLFTHFGVSGPMILSASSHIRNIERGKYSLHIDLKPAISDKELDKRILSDFDKYKNKDLLNAFKDLLPIKMIPTFIELCGIDEHIKVNSINKENRAKIVSLMKDFPLNVTKARDISEAIITSGGISLKEIDSSSMESKLVKNLYFAGEVIDVDAYTGGFNLQIAFSTAYLAANSIVERYNNEEY